MNVTSKSSPHLCPDPQAGSTASSEPAIAPRQPGTLPPGPVCHGNTVASFEPRASTSPAAAPPARLPSGASTISAAALAAQGAAAWPTAKKDQPKGPPVTEQPITTETTPAKAPDSFVPVALKVPWYSQHVDHGSVKGGPTACNAMVREMMKDSGLGATPDGRADASNYDIATARDSAGRIVPNPDLARAGRAYLDAQLDAGKPVMVGVAWHAPNPELNGGKVDHFLVVTGRGVDAEGRQYYTFHDPGARSADSGADTRPENRLFVDAETGLLYRPAPRAPARWTHEARFEVSQVRKNQ